MKVLGLSFGRKNGNCDTVLKQALLGAASTGATVEYLNTCNLNIDRCVGCGACDKVREKGGMSVCIFKDDFAYVEDLIMEADAIIAAAPVYSVAPVGQYKNLCDKMGASHDRSALLRENERRASLGWSEDKMIPAKYFKNRPLGLISIGGASTPGWTSMGLSNMHIIGFSNQMIPVDALDAYGMGDRVNPVFDTAFMNRLFTLGENVGNALNLPENEIEWKGDEGICPVCHCNQLTVRENTTVECSVCGIIGKLSIDNGKIAVSYPEEQIARSRYRLGGLMEHNDEIKGMQSRAVAKMQKDGDKIPALMEPLNVIKEIKKS
ncbi:MAG: flavodoxin family protein [Suipraeoptans sp.]